MGARTRVFIFVWIIRVCPRTGNTLRHDAQARYGGEWWPVGAIHCVEASVSDQVLPTVVACSHCMLFAWRSMACSRAMLAAGIDVILAVMSGWCSGELLLSFFCWYGTSKDGVSLCCRGLATPVLPDIKHDGETKGNKRCTKTVISADR